MKVSNEAKVGALTAIAITVLIMGFNFLKGKNLSEKSERLFAEFTSVEGLVEANPVLINGLPVGTVKELKEKDRNLSSIVVRMNITKDIHIPANSVVRIDKDLLGTATLIITLGTSDEMVKPGDTLASMDNPGIISDVMKMVDPAMGNINKTLESLEVLISKLNTLLDPTVQYNLQQMMFNLNSSSKSLSRLLGNDSGALNKSLNHIEAITANLEKNNGSISNVLTNLETTTGNLSKANIDGVVNSLEATIASLDKLVNQANSKNGSLGLLLNDPKLYNDLDQTIRSLTTLLDDVRINPKRYVNISVFGRKDKNGPLMDPIYDSTSTQKK